jgi:hypothetical protein
VRPKIQGPFLVYFDGKPLTRYQFAAIFKKSLSVQGLYNSHFKSHSFRISAASVAAKNGLNEEAIKAAGRWKSSAYKGYIRNSTIVLPKLVQ